MLAGLAIILTLPLAPLLRVLLACTWLAENIRECRRQIRGAARVRRITLDTSGNIGCTAPDGRSLSLTLRSGSVVLSRLALLRVQFADGSDYVELLRGDPAADLEWQRLQLIWRHCRAAFGRQDGS